MKKVITMFCLCVLLVFSMTACMNGIQVLGTWSSNEDGTGTTYTFEKDGVGKISTGGSLSLNYDFKYTIDGDKLSITSEFSLFGVTSSNTTDYTVSFESGKMILKSGDSSQTFYKVK